MNCWSPLMPWMVNSASPVYFTRPASMNWDIRLVAALAVSELILRSFTSASSLEIEASLAWVSTSFSSAASLSF